MDPDKALFLFGDATGTTEDLEDLEDLEDPIEGDRPDPARLRAAVREVVVSQVVDDDPPEVWATAQRILAAGYSREEALAQLHMAMLHTFSAGLEADDGDPLVDAYLDVLAGLPLPRAGEIAEVYLDVVAGHHPVPAEDADPLVRERLGRPPDDDPLLEVLLDRVADDLVRDDDAPLAYLPPDLLVHVERFTEGIVLTRRLTEAEQELDILTAGFDLAGFARRADLRLPGGAGLPADPEELVVDAYRGGAGYVDWQGPPGWLAAYPAGALLAVRVAGGLVEITELAEEPPVAPDLVARLRAVYDAGVAEPWVPISGEDLVLGLLAGDRTSFSDPQPPLSELAAAAGLEQRGSLVAHEESVWRNQVRVARAWRVHDRLERDAGRAALKAIDTAEPDEPGDGPDDAAMREALAAMTDLQVAAVVLDEVVPIDDPDPDEMERAGAWAGRLVAVAAKPADVALARWAAAVVAERSGDVLAADAHLALALEAGPQLAPALDRAAWYASDRGDAATALRLWRRLENPNPEDLRTLEPFTRTSGRTPGRNDPCWCGSGRKYKTCHIGQPAAIPLPERVGWLCRKAAAYAERRGGDVSDDIFDAVMARALDPDDEDSIDAALEDPIVLDTVLTEGGWFERFLADRGPLLPEDEALLGATWVLVDRTVYEVEDVRAGDGLTVRDLRSGDRTEVREQTFSRLAHPGLLVCGRAVPDGEGHQFVGGLFPVPPGREAAVLDLCEAGEPEDICAWVAALERPPTLLTRENEPIVVCRAVLEVDDAEVARKVLDERYDAEPGGWMEMHDLSEDEQILRATLELHGRRLTVETHSEPRLERVLGVLRAALPAWRVVSEERRPLAPGEMPTPPRLLPGAGEPPAGLAGAVAARGTPVGAAEATLDTATISEIQDMMERRWLDEEVPALGGFTPRQAAADPTRREALVRLLESIPEPEPGSPFFGPRPDRLRALLELDPRI